MADRHPCAGCIHRSFAGNISICEYILDTGRRRPCPAGAGCTVKEKGDGFGMKRKAWDEACARQLLGEGATDIEIADAVGATVGAIASWRHRNHLTGNNAQKKAQKRPTRAPIVPVEGGRPEPTEKQEPSPAPETGPVEISLRLGGYQASLSAPDLQAATWAVARLADIIDRVSEGITNDKRYADENLYFRDRLGQKLKPE